MSDNTTFRCALITGASSGFGAEFARQLVHRCDSMLLVARRSELLEKLTSELRAIRPELKVHFVPADLTFSSDRATVMEVMKQTGLKPDLLINNAGMGDYGEFVDADWVKTETMIRLNVEALTAITHDVLPGMIEQGGGAILNVSSLASLLPIPDFAVYAATKAYVSSLSEALRIELKEHGIQVTALCPGPVHTEFGQVSRRSPDEEIDAFREWFYVDCEQVVSEAIDGVLKNRARVYPGWKIAAGAFALSLLPLAVIRLAMSTRPRR